MLCYKAETHNSNFTKFKFEICISANVHDLVRIDWIDVNTKHLYSVTQIIQVGGNILVRR